MEAHPRQVRPAKHCHLGRHRKRRRHGDAYSARSLRHTQLLLHHSAAILTMSRTLQLPMCWAAIPRSGFRRRARPLRRPGLQAARSDPALGQRTRCHPTPTAFRPLGGRDDEEHRLPLDHYRPPYQLESPPRRYNLRLRPAPIPPWPWPCSTSLSAKTFTIEVCG